MIPEDKRQELEEIRQVLQKLEQAGADDAAYAAVNTQVAQALRAVELFADAASEVIFDLSEA